MRKIIPAFALLILVTLFGCNSGSRLNWHENLEEGLKIAQAENKAVLIDFTGSDWCMWCKRLDAEVFSKTEFAEYASKNLVLVKIDFPKEKELSPNAKLYNQSLAQRFNIEGFPTIVLLRKDGSVIGVTGYVEGGAAAYVSHLSSMVPAN